MTSPQTLSCQYPQLDAGRKLAFGPAIDLRTKTYPGVASGGVDVVSDAGGTIFAEVEIAPRYHAGYRRVVITVDTFDATATYALEISGAGSAAVATPATLAALLPAWVAAIASAYSATVLAAAYDADGDGTDDSILLTGVGVADYAVVVTQSAGAALTVQADAASVAVDVIGRSKSTSADLRATGWRLLSECGHAHSYTVGPENLRPTIDGRGLAAIDVVPTSPPVAVAGDGSTGSGVTYQTTAYAYVGYAVPEAYTP